MKTLVSRGITCHRNNPGQFMPPTYPEAYEIDDRNVEDEKYVVNIREAIKMIVNYDSPDEETDLDEH